jgi:hypothetical protein
MAEGPSHGLVMAEQLCAIRKPGDPSQACQSPVGHGGGHDYAKTVDVLKRTEWDGFKR